MEVKRTFHTVLALMWMLLGKLKHTGWWVKEKVW
jgi:hypothetical protein